MASPGFYDAQALIAKVKILINAQLKSVLKKEGLAVSGVKAAMQDRIITRKYHLPSVKFSCRLKSGMVLNQNALCHQLVYRS